MCLQWFFFLAYRHLTAQTSRQTQTASTTTRLWQDFGLLCTALRFCQRGSGVFVRFYRSFSQNFDCLRLRFSRAYCATRKWRADSTISQNWSLHLLNDSQTATSFRTACKCVCVCRKSIQAHVGDVSLVARFH